MRRRLLVVIVITVGASACFADDCKAKSDFGAWLTCRIGARMESKMNHSNEAIKQNAMNGARQQDSPSVSGNSNSLVDQSSASDLVNLALNLAKLTPSTSDNNNPTSVSVSTSLYALYAASNRHDPLDPDFYSRNRDWRRFFITLGQDVPKTVTPGSSSTVDPHANRYGTIVGLKALLWNGRDVSDPRNRAIFSNVLDALSDFGQARSQIRVDLHNQIAGIDRDGSDKPFAKLSTEQDALVDQIIDKHLPEISNMEQVAQKAFEDIKKRRQWAISYSAELRDSLGYNKHSVQSVLDWGVTPRLNWTSNFGLDVYDAKQFGRNRNGGSASTEFQFQITEDMKQPQPVMVSFSGYGEWLTNVAPTYKVQGKLTIPLGQKTGVSLPISVTYASRTDLVQEAHTEAKFGFTFDAAKIASALLPGVGK